MMSPEAKKKMDDFNNVQPDWFAVCRKCLAKLEGTPAELKAHKCAEDE